jgi:hypothetical protein
MIAKDHIRDTGQIKGTRCPESHSACCGRRDAQTEGEHRNALDNGLRHGRVPGLVQGCPGDRESKRSQERHDEKKKAQYASSCQKIVPSGDALAIVSRCSF